MTIHVGDAGTYKEAQQIYVGDAGTWKEVQEGYVGDAGVWKPMFSSGPEEFQLLFTTLSDGDNAFGGGAIWGGGTAWRTGTPEIYTPGGARIMNIFFDGEYYEIFSVVLQGNQPKDHFSSITIDNQTFNTSVLGNAGNKGINYYAGDYGQARWYLTPLGTTQYTWPFVFTPTTGTKTVIFQ